MTDNRTTKLDTTELLCKLLEERGIEWKDGDAAYEIEWNTPDGRHCSAMYWKPTFTVLVSGCTPEQAIAATLGSGTCKLEPLSALDVTLNMLDQTEWGACSECGCAVPMDARFCNECGKAVSE